jgi:hypothetical protein
MAMGRHGRNNPKKVPGAQYIAPLLFHNFHFFGNYHLSLVNYEKPVGVGFPFDHYVRVLIKIDKG